MAKEKKYKRSSSVHIYTYTLDKLGQSLSPPTLACLMDSSTYSYDGKNGGYA